MILIPRFTDMYSKTPLIVGMGYRGEFKLTMRDLNGRFLYETDWMPNLITNGGLDNVATGSFMDNWYVGSGTNVPAFTDTQLQTLTGTGTGVGAPSGSYGNLGAPNYTSWGIRGQRFVAGQGTGTINEIGMGASSTDLSIRALVTPGIVKAADQIMDITHKTYVDRDYITSDLTGSIDISGVTYNYTLRASEVAMQQTSTGFGAAAQFGGPAACYGNIVAATVTGASSVWRTTYIGQGSTVLTAYTPGSYTRHCSTSWTVDQGNHASGIRTLVWTDGVQEIIDFALGAYMRNPGFQCQFDNAADGTSIPKNADKTLTMQATRSWRRT